MKTETIKQAVILLIAVIGLYLSGLNLIKISNIQSLSDVVTVMTFFACFFPALILTANLSAKALKSFLKVATH
ncbi:hypothetical protein K8354_07795 [Polaribacter litorisediminis]|uniref:hypothetical protein n=1 Tax=Polaribacter litorisediminis TaxID=1908341 RepID=UPI001CBF0141|nr:hypothetical protein [Polaribacter litorisediminis]UAM99695.1 hypothetical protein K8354_07790 [Polaribacter litorisediminis]UAM99696.1 hypothetical protein K8354_07795 [Polaribacter litorisediminis]